MVTHPYLPASLPQQPSPPRKSFSPHLQQMSVDVVSQESAGGRGQKFTLWHVEVCRSVHQRPAIDNLETQSRENRGVWTAAWREIISRSRRCWFLRRKGKSCCGGRGYTDRSWSLSYKRKQSVLQSSDRLWIRGDDYRIDAVPHYQLCGAEFTESDWTHITLTN